MSVNSFEDLAQHVGHDIVVTDYGPADEVQNVAIECETCSEVLVDFDRPAENEDLPDCTVCGQQVEPDWVEKHEHYSRWTGPLIGKYVEVNGYGGIAFVVKHHSTESDSVVAVMVQDDREHTFEVTDCRVISEDDFCRGCGQMGAHGE